jgi:hypothetical protein
MNRSIWACPFVLEGVLRGQDEERSPQAIGFPVRGHLALLHHLEKSRLRLRGRAVDLVGEQKVREDGSGLEVELLLLHVVDRVPGEIRRHQVRCELDAAEVAGHRSREDVHEKRLPEPRRALEEHAPFGEERHDHSLHQALLPHDDFRHLGAGLLEELRDLCQGHGIGSDGCLHECSFV